MPAPRPPQPALSAEASRGRMAAAAPHWLAANAALEIMEAGGNAVDAAVAANAVQGVVEPHTCGMGGDLFALVWTPGAAEPACLNASGRAGSGADPQNLRDRGLTRMPLYGPETVTVPGCVDGWHALAERFGTLPLAVSLAPAVRLATDGFPVSGELAGECLRRRTELGGQGSAGALFADGDPPAEGERVFQPGLAVSLQAAAGGRDGFYLDRLGGPLGEAVGGRITRDDLSRGQADWVRPAGTRIFGRAAWTPPPNSQGYLILAGLRMFEMLEAPADPSHPAYLHALLECYRAAAWERNVLVSDPDSAPQAEWLLDEERLAQKAARFDPVRAGSWPFPNPAPGGTAYLCVADGNGMGASLIGSNFHGFGSGLSAGRTGVWLHNRGAGFSLRPGHPNELRPGRRPLHTLSPTLWTKDGELELLAGTRGGLLQPQLMMQTAAHLFRAGMDPEAAQSAWRWTIDQSAPPALRRYRSLVKAESRIPPDLAAALRRKGHQITEAAPWMPEWGPVSIIRPLPEGFETAPDPRIPTTAALTRHPPPPKEIFRVP